MSKAQTVGRKQKQLLKGQKGPSVELAPGKAKGQLQKARVNKFLLKGPHRTSEVLGKRGGPHREAMHSEVGRKVQKKD